MTEAEAQIVWAGILAMLLGSLALGGIVFIVGETIEHFTP